MTAAHTLFLVRHGQTVLNAEGRFRGRLDPPLDDRGVAQARRAAHLIAETAVGAVYASPLRRTMATAGFVADAYGLTVVEAPELIDLDYGSWQGLTWDEAEEANPETMKTFRVDPLSVVLPGGEAVADAAKRIRATMKRLATQSSAPEAIVAVSHNLLIRAFLAEVMGLSGDTLWQFDVSPGSVIRLSAGPDGFEVVDPPRL